MTTLDAAIDRRYPHTSAEAHRVREAVRSACNWFLQSGLGDRKAEQCLCSDDTWTYWQQLTEVLLAKELVRATLSPRHSSEGPDFLVSHDDVKVWIEAICPTPQGLPQSWTVASPGTVTNLPHEEILLRWTAAIKEKAEKLIGNDGRGVKGYLTKGIVGPADVYVIAINGRLLRGGSPAFPELLGISQLPYAVEATFSVGPQVVQIDRATGHVTGSGHQHRPVIPKMSGAKVPADTFLDPVFAPISAIWAIDIDERVLLDKTEATVVVHNPMATKPLPKGLLPAHSEYVATDLGSEFRLDRVDGRDAESEPGPL